MKKFAIVLAICMLLPLNALALQPLSVSGQEGLNVAVGVASLHLRAGE
jgi:hypothetical protein